MPDDPIVNDHYGDILWKSLENSVRYSWSMVSKMKDTEKDLLEKIKIKLVTGLKTLDELFNN